MLPRGENGRYQTMVPISLAAGAHEVDLMLTVPQTVNLRASIALVTDQARYRRPERITATDDPRADTRVRFRRRLQVTRPIEYARIRVASNAPCQILVDEREIGRQGGFMPYGDYHAIHPYDVTDVLTVGAA